MLHIITTKKWWYTLALGALAVLILSALYTAAQPVHAQLRAGAMSDIHQPNQPQLTTTDTRASTPTNTPDPCASVWPVVPSPNVGTNLNYLAGVAAVSPNDIWAAGDATLDRTLTEHYSGPCVNGSPTLTPAATPSSTPTATPTLVNTNTPNPCPPVWSVVTSPNPSSSNNLSSVAAVSANNVWAVGSYGPYDASQPLTVHWDGTQLSVIAGPNLGSTSSFLTGVAAVSANDVWAVGDYFDSIGHRTLTIHWDGTQWRLVPSPNPGSPNYLNGVAAVSANDAWAVGYYFGSSGSRQTLIMHWDGTRWRLVPSPNLGSSLNYLNGVVAVSANDAWAVGYYETSSVSIDRTLIIHWDGTQWSVVTNPNPGSTNTLYAVAAVSANDIWAVGSYFDNGNGVQRTLTMHWDGTQWRLVPSPSIGSAWNGLRAVTTVSGNDVWAVDEYNTISSRYRTLTMHWDGTQWSVVQSPSIGSSENFLWGVAAVSANDIWAVGNFMDNGSSVDQTLVLRYSGSCVTGIPTRTNTPSSPTNTPTLTSTATLCPLSFTNVLPSDYFYQAVRYLYCHGAISGYADGTFKPYNNTRGQLSKIAVLAEGWTIYTPPSPTFRDVAMTDPFYQYIETAYSHSIISGYGCGSGCLEFRPGNNVTRGQLSKIVVLAEGWPVYTPATPTFSDVAADNPFYAQIETAYYHNIISGYSCSPGTGCLEFRPGNNATRGQIAKIVYLAVTQP